MSVTVSVDMPGAAFTVSVVLPTTFPLVAEIVVVPAFTAEARPVVLIVAVAGVRDAHVTPFSALCVPSLYTPVAANCNVPPAVIVEFCGVTMIDCSVGAAPVPVSGTLCGLPAALSETPTAALRAPAAVGVNVTFTVQNPFTTSGPEQLFVWPKSPALDPVMEIAGELKVSVAVPLLVTVKPCGVLAVSNGWEGKLSELALNCTPGAPVPVPETVSDGVEAALSVIATFPLSTPKAVGVKSIVIVQMPPAAIGEVVVQFCCVTEKLLVTGLNATDEIVSGAFPVFVRITFCEGLAVLMS